MFSLPAFCRSLYVGQHRAKFIFNLEILPPAGARSFAMARLPRLIVVLLWVLCWRPAFVGHGAERNSRRECVARRVRERRRATGRPRQAEGSLDGHTHPKARCMLFTQVYVAQVAKPCLAPPQGA